MAMPNLRFKADDGSAFPDWETTTVGNLFSVSAGGDLDKNRSTAIPIQSDSYPFPVYANSLEQNGLVGYASYYKVEGDTFTVTGRGNIGHATARHEKYVPIVRLLVCKPKQGDIVDFFAYQINSINFLEESTGVPQLTAPSLRQIKLKRPCIEEQRKIAECLGAFDEVIAKAKAEIEVWELRKKGVIQRLFSQEVRFKADDGSIFPAWKTLSFSKVFSRVTNNSLSWAKLIRESDSSTHHPKNIHYGDIHTRFGEVLDLAKDQVPVIKDDVDCSRLQPLQEGDVVFADAAEDDTVGKAIEVYNLGANVLYAGLHTIACRPKITFAPKYLGYYLNAASFHDQLRPYMQRTKVTSISKTNIALTYVSVPSPQEQRKIADCLYAIDEVIAKAKAELELWRELKRGLLQQLFV